METPTTCGQGVAAHAVLPERAAALFEAIAATLAHHRKALDLSDGAAREEDEAYAKLVVEMSEVVTRLRSVEARMSGYLNLPMGRHEESAMAGPESVAVFEKYVEAEEHLLSLLQLWLARDRRMLDSMR
jgi:hypothetical protein